MSENIPSNRRFFQKLIDRVVYILTGEKPKRRRSHRPIDRPVVKKEEERKPVILSKRAPARKQRQSAIAGFLNNLINPVKRHRRRTNSPKANLRPPVIRANIDHNSDQHPLESVSEIQNTERKVEPVLINRQKIHKKRSFIKRFFRKGSKKRISKDRRQDIREEMLRSLPGEGYALLNSLGFYILAYLSVYFIYQFTETLVAANFSIDSVLFYYEIYFPIGNSSPLWTRFNIIAITLASPFVSILTALILLKVVLMRERLNPQLRLFLLWVAFHGATHFLGAFVAGIATSQGFGYVANWMYMNVFFRILVSLIFLFLLTIIGYFSAVFALETLPAGVRQHRWRLSLALMSRFIMPWIIGGLLVIVVKYPNAIPQHPNIMVYDAIIIATMGFMVIPAFFNYKAKPRSLTERPSRYKSPPGILISVIAVLVLVLFRLAFDRGIHFVINFTFDVGYYR